MLKMKMVMLLRVKCLTAILSKLRVKLRLQPGAQSEVELELSGENIVSNKHGKTFKFSNDNVCYEARFFSL